MAWMTCKSSSRSPSASVALSLHSLCLSNLMRVSRAGNGSDSHTVTFRRMCSLDVWMLFPPVGDTKLVTSGNPGKANFCSFSFPTPVFLVDQYRRYVMTSLPSACSLFHCFKVNFTALKDGSLYTLTWGQAGHTWRTGAGPWFHLAPMCYTRCKPPPPHMWPVLKCTGSSITFQTKVSSRTPALSRIQAPNEFVHHIVPILHFHPAYPHYGCVHKPLLSLLLCEEHSFSTSSRMLKDPVHITVHHTPSNHARNAHIQLKSPGWVSRLSFFLHWLYWIQLGALNGS